MCVVMNIVTRSGYLSCTFPGNIFDPIPHFRFSTEEKRFHKPWATKREDEVLRRRQVNKYANNMYLQDFRETDASFSYSIMWVCKVGGRFGFYLLYRYFFCFGCSRCLALSLVNTCNQPTNKVTILFIYAWKCRIHLLNWTTVELEPQQQQQQQNTIRERKDSHSHSQNKTEKYR